MNITLSIITINFNCSPGLDNTLSSLSNIPIHTKYQFEIILIDGDSTDDSLIIAARHKTLLEKKFWKVVIISEKDDGIYFAMNKGIKLACGNYIMFLNSGDTIEKGFFNVFKNYVESIESFSQIWRGTFCLGGAVKFERSGNILYKKPLIDSVNFLLTDLPAHHQGLVVPISVYNEFGLHNVKHNIVADFEFMIRIVNSKKVKIINSPEVFVNMSPGGISQRKTTFLFRAAQRYFIMRLYYGTFFASIHVIIFISYRLFKFILKKLI